MKAGGFIILAFWTEFLKYLANSRRHGYVGATERPGNDFFCELTGPWKRCFPLINVD